MQVAFYLSGEITQVKESIPWVRCASGNVFLMNEYPNMFVSTKLYKRMSEYVNNLTRTNVRINICIENCTKNQIYSNMCLVFTLTSEFLNISVETNFTRSNIRIYIYTENLIFVTNIF